MSEQVELGEIEKFDIRQIWKKEAALNLKLIMELFVANSIS